MSDDDRQVRWTEEQWAKIRQVVHEEATRTRVAASFLPLYGPLSPDTVTMPIPRLHESLIEHEGQNHDDEEDGPDGKPYDPSGPRKLRIDVNDTRTLPILSIAAEVYVKSSQMSDPDLNSALLMFRRAANLVARAEDEIVFNGWKPEPKAPASTPVAPKWLKSQTDSGLLTVRPTGPTYKGLLDADLVQLVKDDNKGKTDQNKDPLPVNYSENIVTAIVAAINQLEDNLHLGPFACVLGDTFFLAANTPIPNSMVLPSDRITPFLNGPLLRSSVIDVKYQPASPGAAASRPGELGVVVALGGAPVELVVAHDISVSFLQVDRNPRWIFRVAERILLRIKEEKAVVRLQGENFQPPKPRTDHAKRLRETADAKAVAAQAARALDDQYQQQNQAHDPGLAAAAAAAAAVARLAEAKAVVAEHEAQGES